MNVHIFGIRHHSPACAKQVDALIRGQQPKAVLIEGPSDFNPRLHELALPHRLPIALYSYAHTDEGAAQCWYPFLEYSPEWVALRAGLETGASVRFIDLPHWHYRALADTRRRRQTGRDEDRHTQVTAALCASFRCDGDDMLWDRLFEAAPEAELPARLDGYFAALRGDGPGSPEDQAREDFMARHIAACAAQYETVLVICGGWHKPALEALWPQHVAAGVNECPEPPTVPDDAAAGSYLVPYEFRQVDALAGYGAGMQSPLFYQWCWQDGRGAAIRKATANVVQRLRARRLAFSTADFIAFRLAVEGLSRLRGNDPPTRADFLDGLLSSAVKEALDRPPPWSERGFLTPQDHPILREALLALTGELRGKLDPATPQPPLVKDVEQTLAALDLSPATRPRDIILDRRETADQARAEALWRLKLLGINGVSLRELRAPQAARGLPEALRFEEHWTLVLADRWHPDLIEASLHGATLALAAENALLASLDNTQAASLANALAQGIRAGFHALGGRLATELAALLPKLHEHGDLAKAGLPLAELAQTGFWGQDARSLLEPALSGIGARLLWLLDGHQAAGPLEHDVNAVRFLLKAMELDLPSFDGAFALDTLLRLSRRLDAPPALRGAALGAAYSLGAADAAAVLTATRSVPPRDALGDFLFGLFSCARELATADDAIVGAVQAAVEMMPVEDFLVALPSLRGAFTWFPPRERGAIAARVAKLLGLSQALQLQLLRVPAGPGGLLDAKRIEAQALAWAEQIGLKP